MSAWGLARQLDTDRTTTAEYIDRYFARYPGVRAGVIDRMSAAAELDVELLVEAGGDWDSAH